VRRADRVHEPSDAVIATMSEAGGSGGEGPG
jgi:hypothetical protein